MIHRINRQGWARIGWAFVFVGLAAAALLLGAALFEQAAPVAARLMKFAVQRAKGVAVVGTVAVVTVYVGIAAAVALQRRDTQGPEARPDEP